MQKVVLPARPAQDSRAALGCDYSASKVNLAKVDRDGFRAMRVVELANKDLSQQVTALMTALAELEPCTTMVIEDSFVHLRADEVLASGEPRLPNYLAALRLTAVRSMVATVASAMGMYVYVLASASWRSQAGVFQFSSSRRRDDLKKAAIRLVKLEYGYETKNDNEAEAILMAKVAIGLASRNEAARGRR